MKKWFHQYSTFKVEDIISLGISYAIKLLIATILLIVGFWLINRLLRFSERTLQNRDFDLTYRRFIRNLLNFSLKGVLIIAILNFAGFRTTSVIALLGAAGLAVGLALQGTLTNFAGGVLLLLFKPFKVGDLIEAQGKKGIVAEIHIFTTMIIAEDERRIFIPNSMLSNGIIENQTYQKSVRAQDLE